MNSKEIKEENWPGSEAIQAQKPSHFQKEKYTIYLFIYFNFPCTTYPDSITRPTFYFSTCFHPHFCTTQLHRCFSLEEIKQRDFGPR